ncbi:uracil-DNA glycosylase [Treponema sp. OMZ 840]|uniref:uracil-DNA glycosylase n=1 Tax=Treponema sp. OMZ 840 TaxID=244313 RepID=UPI003D8D15A8
MHNLSASDARLLTDVLNLVDTWVSGVHTTRFDAQKIRSTAPSAFVNGKMQASKTETPENTDSAASETNAFSMQNIAEKIAQCSRCELCRMRTKTVPGFGCPNPVVMVIGEGPGADEDRSGLPFVGPAGQLLDKMLAAIQLSRHSNCFIGNVVKCRPPHNRDPKPEESEACASFLHAQIQILKPKMILAVGRIAAQNLLATSEGIGKLRGRFFSYRNIPLMSTYHPSALLRDVSLKKPAWEDLKLFRSRLLELDPSYTETFIDG